MLGMNQRYRPDAQVVKALVDRGELGEIYHGKAYWLRRAGSPKFGTWFVNKKLSGGGCMLDIGVHYLDLALHLMGNWKPVSVTTGINGLSGVSPGSDPLRSAKDQRPRCRHFHCRTRRGNRQSSLACRVRFQRQSTLIVPLLLETLNFSLLLWLHL